jgi:tetratricopeptide (TPR) repeat protein
MTLDDEPLQDIEEGKAIELDCEDFDTYRQLGDMYEKESCFDDALECYLKAAEFKEDGSWEFLNHWGIIVSDWGRIDEALEFYNKALSDPEISIEGRNEVNYNCGVLLLEDERLDEALVHLNDAVNLGLETAEAYYHLGLAHAKLGYNVIALKNFNDAITENPHWGEYHLRLAQTQEELGKIDSAKESYQKAIQLDINNHEARIGLENITEHSQPKKRRYFWKRK